MKVRLGTRSSKLALWQTSRVLELLAAAEPGAEFEIVKISTHGDETLERPLPEIGGAGLFTEKIEAALRAGKIDAAVHSLKDLPVDDAPGTVVAAVLGRDEARDVLVSRTGRPLSDLPPGSVVGTSSTRREAQIRAARPDVSVRPIRGNVETRIAKVETDEYDATVLAGAGVARLGLSHRVSEWLDVERFVPAPGQGALAVQCRGDDAAMKALLSRIDDPLVRRATRAEREFLRALGGGCAAPVGAFARASAEGARMTLRGRVISTDGRQRVDVEAEGDEPDQLGRSLAEKALEAGAAEILAAARTRPEEPLPLAGRRILVTRPRAQARSLLELLARQGAIGISLPLIRTEPAGDAARIAEAVRCISTYDWVLFTSANSVQHFFSSANGEIPDPAGLRNAAAVGPATAQALRARGIAPALIAEGQTGASLARCVIERSGSSTAAPRVLFPCAEESSPETARTLREAGALVEELPVYRTVAEAPSPADLERVRKGVDVIVFMSGSAARAFRSLMEREPWLATIARDAVVACIGESTAENAHAAGLRVDVVPEKYDSESLVAAIAFHFIDKSRSTQ